jgi:hypothetical protein
MRASVSSRGAFGDSLFILKTGVASSERSYLLGISSTGYI